MAAKARPAGWGWWGCVQGGFALAVWLAAVYVAQCSDRCASAKGLITCPVDVGFPPREGRRCDRLLLREPTNRHVPAYNNHY